MFGQVKSETEDKGLRMIEQITRKETSWMNDQERTLQQDLEVLVRKKN